MRASTQERTITRLDHAVFFPSPDSYEQVPEVQGLDQSFAATARPGRRVRRIELTNIVVIKRWIILRGLSKNEKAQCGLVIEEMASPRKRSRLVLQAQGNINRRKKVESGRWPLTEERKQAA